MRQIKFRIYIKPLERYAGDYDATFYYHYPNMEPKWTVVTPFGGHYSDEDLIVEQETGLEDKNGQRIWEGDIVSEHKGDIIGRISQHKSGEWRIEWIGVHGGWSKLYDHRKLCEVVGNSHESTMREK